MDSILKLSNILVSCITETRESMHLRMAAPFVMQLTIHLTYQYASNITNTLARQRTVKMTIIIDVCLNHLITVTILSSYR